MEYAPASDVIGRAAGATGVPRAELRRQVGLAGERIAGLLKLGASPFTIDDSGVRVGGIAGLVRVTPTLELELVPKFLNPLEPGWREDFFYLATLSRHGRLLPAEQLRASTHAEADLATLVARAMIGMYWANHRRPLRTYGRHTIQEFAIDGDVDPESVILPEPDGFTQRVVRYSRQNQFNAAIATAAQSLLPEVSDPQTRRQLVRIYETLSPQRTARHFHRRNVPSRARRWQPVYDLALEVLDGFGVAYDAGHLRAPGYVLSTWQVWEDFVTLAVRLGLGSSVVGAQTAAALGVRVSETAPGSERRSTAWVTPDITFRDAPSAQPVLIDAKYKTRRDAPRTRISEGDLYEALAFASATRASRVILVYPAVPETTDGAGALGACKVTERIEVNDVTVVALAVGACGVSKRGGLRAFSNGLASGIRSAATDAYSTIAPTLIHRPAT